MIVINENLKDKIIKIFVILLFIYSFVSFCVLSSLSWGIVKNNYQRDEKSVIWDFWKNARFTQNGNDKRSEERQEQNSNAAVSIERFYNPNSDLGYKGDLVTLVEKTSPAVVTVLVKKDSTRNISLIDSQTTGVGTGFFISDDGLLVTNEHVVCNATSNDIRIVTYDNKVYKVNSVAVDPAQDIAIIKVDTRGEKISFLKFAKPDYRVRVGESVIAIGNPFGDNPGSVTSGIVSGVNRNITAVGGCGIIGSSKDYEGVIQTDAAINTGNSGGPLLNMQGDVIGINSATLVGANNISYTVPHHRVLRVLQRYFSNNGKIVSPFLGITHRMLNTNEIIFDEDVIRGALVISVQQGAPADLAGIRAGDVITKIGDLDVNFSLVATLQNFEPGQQTIVRVYRIDKDTRRASNLDLSIVIGSRVYEVR